VSKEIVTLRNHPKSGRTAGITVIVFATTACVAAVAAPGRTAQLNRSVATAAVKKYLQEKGNLCLGKFTWPIEVTEADRTTGTNDALQMPVLERLGLVVSSAVAQGKRYELTAEGRKYYLERKMTTLGPGDSLIEHSGDLCVATLSLDKVVKWTVPEIINGRRETTVAYTYKIVPAHWTADPEVRKVFPRVDMVIRGEGTLQLKETFQLEKGNWIPVLPGT